MMPLAVIGLKIKQKSIGEPYEIISNNIIFSYLNYRL